VVVGILQSKVRVKRGAASRNLRFMNENYMFGRCKARYQAYPPSV
jgi:hypothetical protein